MVTRTGALPIPGRLDAAIDPLRSVLVLVDFQERLMPAIHGGADVLSRAVRLADAANLLGIRVIGTEENPERVGPNAAAIRERCAATVAKMRFDACADGLLEALGAVQGDPPADVVIAGCEAHVCMLQTALGLLRGGFRVWVVANACGSRSPRHHELAMARLRAAGAGVVSDEMVLFEWLGACTHPRFREVLVLVKSLPP